MILMTPADALEPQIELEPPFSISICSILLVVSVSKYPVPLGVLGSFILIPSISMSV